MNAPRFENDHNVYILGAGFSAEAGLPLVANFMPTMREAVGWLTKQGRTAEVEAIQRVLQYRLEAAGAAYRTTFDPDNIEELFSLASADTTGALDEDMRRSMAATLDYAARVGAGSKVRIIWGNEWTGGPPQGTGWEKMPPESIGFSGKYAAIADRYETLCAMLTGQLSPPEPDRKNTFISFNYDLVADHALQGIGYRIDYGIDPASYAAIPDWATRDATEESVQLLKLHGSMNWTLVGDRISVQDGYYPKRVQEAPLMVPPTWRKSMGGHLERVWKQAVEALRTATRVVVIGFSIPKTDVHFRYLLAAGLRQNISLKKIVFVDPAGEEIVRKRASEILHEDMATRQVLDVVSRKTQGLIWEGGAVERIGRGLAHSMMIRGS